MVCYACVCSEVPHFFIFLCMKPSSVANSASTALSTPCMSGWLDRPVVTAHPLRRSPSSSPHRVRFDTLESSWSEDSDYYSPSECEYFKQLMAVCRLDALEIELHKIANLRSEIVRSELNLCGVCMPRGPRFQMFLLTFSKLYNLFRTFLRMVPLLSGDFFHQEQLI